MDTWKDFFVTSAGAAAALTGLIFVGVSINLAKILSVPRLPERALQSLVLLLTILILSLLYLIPMQPLNWIGIEFLVISLSIWMMMVKIDISNIKNTKPEYKHVQYSNSLFSQLATLPMIISGIEIFCGNNMGFYWAAAAIIFSFIKAILDAWVLLVEINR